MFEVWGCVAQTHAFYREPSRMWQGPSEVLKRVVTLLRIKKDWLWWLTEYLIPTSCLHHLLGGIKAKQTQKRLA